MDSIFNKISKKDLLEFIDFCSPYISIDKNKLYSYIVETTKYYKGNDLERNKLRELQDLEIKWYKSLKNNNPDYSVYGSDYFLGEVWACWIIYSRKYLLSLKSEKSLINKSIIADIGLIKSIIDLGCGIGYTTAGLKELFPKAKVYGTNIEDSYQWKVASELGKKYKFSLLPDAFQNKSIDLIFASEYFEHIENAVEHVADIINNCHPKILIIANSFGTESVGHFIKYKYMDGWYDGKATSRMFNNILRKMGYEKIDTKLWNNKPAYWKLNIDNKKIKRGRLF